MSFVISRSCRPVKRYCSRCYSSTQIEQHDLVVVGGGPAGLALTAALASSETISSTHKITLLEGNSLNSITDWNPTSISKDQSNRVSSITKENREWLTKIGVWQHVDKTRTRDIKQMQVWDGLSDARIQFNSSSRGSSMATLTENLNLQRAALKRIKQLGDRVELLDRMKVKQITRDTRETGGGWPIVNLENSDATIKRSLRARLLIGADGANSPVKTFSDIETFGWNYDRQGVVASLNLDELGQGSSSTHTAFQRFLPQGPIAFLPLSDNTASLVWSTTPQFAKLFKLLPPLAFSHLINLAFCLPYSQLYSILDQLSNSSSSLPDSEALISSLKEIHQTHLEKTYSPAISTSDLLPPLVTSIQSGSIASFPLRLSHTSSYLGLPSPSGGNSTSSPQDLRTVLVGDAAHTIHPLAGQGLNLGLLDSTSLVQVIENSIKNGTDSGSYISLLPYPRERYFKNHLVLSTCDHLNSLYSLENRLGVWVRSNGLEVLNELDGFKDLLMGGAGGASGSSSNSSGGWGFVAGAMENVGKVRDLVGFAGNLVGGIVKKRATEFVVKGR
ncbi:hypothetical protein JCM3765_002254 [Sporobolomyces pararoseus]